MPKATTNTKAQRATREATDDATKAARAQAKSQGQARVRTIVKGGKVYRDRADGSRIYVRKASSPPSRKPTTPAKQTPGAGTSPGVAGGGVEAELASYVKKAIDTQFAPQETALLQETNLLADRGRQGGRIEQVWDSYLRDMSARAQTQAQLGAGFVDQAKQAADGSGAQALLGGQQVAKGGPLTPGAENVAPVNTGDFASKLAAVNQSYGAAGAANLASEQAFSQDQLSDYLRIGGREKIDSLEQNQRALSSLGDKNRELQAQKGAARTEMVSKVKSDAANQALAERALLGKEGQAEAELLLKRMGLQEDRAARIVDDRRESEELALKRRKIDLDAYDDNRKRQDTLGFNERKLRQRDRELDLKELSIKSKVGKDGAAPVLSNRDRTTWRTKKARVLAVAAEFRSMNRSKKFRDTAEMTERLLKRNPKLTREEINMGRDIAKFNRLSATNRKVAEAYFPGGYVPKGFRTETPAR